LFYGEIEPGQPGPPVRVWVSDLDGGNPRLVYTMSGGYAQWLDDERLLIVRRIAYTAETQLHILRVNDPPSEAQLLGSYQNLRGLQVAPGGAYLAFALLFQEDPARSGIYVQRTRPGSTPRQLPFFGAYRWRDERTLYTLSFDGAQDAHALGVADALQLFAGLAVDLRWPNDVLVGDRKLAGILAQFQEGALLAGVGLNVNQREFPPELAPLATSLLLETGREQDPEFLLRALVRSIESHVNILETAGAEPILRLFESASSYASGRRVRVELPGGEINGVTAGLSAEGFLRVRREDGSLVTVTAGGVRPAP
jgi:biotin-[acetyl-CoA-carboxylase] ligase BirA-like protein